MDKRDSIISVVTSPLGFFALALLIIEGFLAIVVIGSSNTLTSEAKLIGVYIAVGAFALIVMIVALMVWLIPDHLTFRGVDWMEKARMSKSWADDQNPTTKIDLEKLEQTKAS